MEEGRVETTEKEVEEEHKVGLRVVVKKVIVKTKVKKVINKIRFEPVGTEIRTESYRNRGHHYSKLLHVRSPPKIGDRRTGGNRLERVSVEADMIRMARKDPRKLRLGDDPNPII
ncbi:hypothetical protein Q3G72_004621 [Acer saccharum]|nr:hypothetical protein Q3G72_004621 [Acer saccharum]